MPDNHVHYLHGFPGTNKNRVITGPPVGEGFSHTHDWQLDGVAGRTGPGIPFPGGHFHSFNSQGSESRQITSPQVYQSVKSGLDSLNMTNIGEFFRQMFSRAGTEPINSTVQKLVKEITRDVKIGQTRVKRNIRYFAGIIGRFLGK